MSTKCTLDHGDHHHLYVDMFEPGKVFLMLVGAEFEARPGSVTVAIPADLWERLRGVRIASEYWWDEEDDRGDA